MRAAVKDQSALFFSLRLFVNNNKNEAFKFNRYLSKCIKVALFLTISHVSFSSSTSTLISSGIAMAGWVSFSWMATCKRRTSKVKKELFVAQQRATHNLFRRLTSPVEQKHIRGDHFSIFCWFLFYFSLFYLNLLFYLVRQFAEVCASNLPGAKLRHLETTDDVLQGGRHHKVFLLQTELLSFKELRMKTHICQFVFGSQACRGVLFLGTQNLPDIFFLMDMEIIVIFM